MVPAGLNNFRFYIKFVYYEVPFFDCYHIKGKKLIEFFYLTQKIEVPWKHLPYITKITDYILYFGITLVEESPHKCCCYLPLYKIYFQVCPHIHSMS